MRSLFAWLRKRWRPVAIIALAVVVLPLLILYLLIAQLVGDRLVSQIRQRLNTELTVGYFLYDFPYGLTAHKCHMQLPGSFGPNQTVDVKEVAVTLDEFPLGNGPVIVRELTLVDPVVHLTTGRPAATEPTTLPASEPRKISDILRLHHLTVKNGQFIIADESNGGPGGNLTWTGIDINVQSAPRGAAQYDFKLDARNGQIADLAGGGTFDVDQRSSSFDHFTLNVRCDENRPLQLPPALQRIWERYRVRGNLQVTGSAKGSLVNPLKRSFQSTLTLKNASAHSPQLDAALTDLSMSMTAGSDGQKISGQLSEFTARIGDTIATAAPGLKIDADLSDHQWSVENINGSIIGDAPATLPPETQPSTSQPSDATQPMPAQTRVGGQLVFWGHAKSATRPDAPADCQIRFSCKDAALRCPRPRIDLSKVAMDGGFYGDRCDVNYFQCHGFGGALVARGTIATTDPHPYNFNIDARNASLLDIALLFDPQLRGGQAQGRVYLAAGFQGKLKDQGFDSSQFGGRGRFVIVDGNLWDTHTLRQIEKRASIARDALTAGQAAAHFTVDSRHVELQDATLSAPVLGLQGSGTIDFDGNLDLRVIGLPLSDWKRQLNKAQIPIVGKALSEAAGGVQSVLSSITHTLLYEFHVTGKGSDPTVETVPSPALSEQATDIFRKMVNRTEENAPAPTQLPDEE